MRMSLNKRVLFILGSFALFVFLASRIYYEEDISKLLPLSKESRGARYAFDKLQVKDKIFLEFRGRGGLLAGEDLAWVAEEFCDSLKAHDTKHYIEDLLYKVEDTLIERVAEVVLDNAPLFVGEDFFDKASKVLNIRSVDSLMRENLAYLESGEGSAYYEIIRRDPLSFRSLATREALPLNIGGGLFAPDDSLYIAYLSPAFKAMDSGAGGGLVDNITEEITRYEREHPDIEILFFGSPVQSVFNAKRIKKDLALTVTFALLIICILIGYCFRQKRVFLSLLLPILYGVAFAMAMVYLIQGQISFIALGLGSIVVGVALSYCMHVITHYSYKPDIEEVMKAQTRPIILGCLTTVGSLLGLLLTRSPLLRDFGLMAACVMIGTCAFVLLFLPVLLARPCKSVSSQRNERRNDRRNKKAFALIEKITTYPYYKRKWLIISVLTIFIASLILTGGKAKFDTNLVNIGYFEPKVMLADSLYTQRVNGGLESEFYAVFSKNLDSALVYNAEVKKLCEDLKDASALADYSNTSDILQPRKTQIDKIRRWQTFFTPEKKALIKKLIASFSAKYGFEEEMFEPFFELLDKKFEPIDLYSMGVIPKGLMANLLERTEDGEYLVFTSVRAASKELLSRCSRYLTHGHFGEHTLVVNPFFYTSDMLSLLSGDFNRVLLISSLFVFLILLIAFRNILYAIIAFLPMGMSWYIVLGVMRVVGVEFNLINIVISTFIFGMGVDYSIFVMDGLIRGKSGELLKYHRSAIFFSAVMLILAVVSLIFAVHPAIASIGFSTLVGMLATIAITFILQPFLFYLVKKKKSDEV